MFSELFQRYNFIYILLAVITASSAWMFFTIDQKQTCSAPKPLLAFLDVGQGDATYMQDDKGSSILIDTGPKDSGVLMQIQNVTKCPDVHIDHLILTHPDSDHIAEAERLIQKGLVGEVVHNGFMDVDQKDESATENRLEVLDIKRRLVKTGDTLDLNGIHIDVLFPSENLYLATSSQSKSKKKLDDNDFSLVIKVTASTTLATSSFLLTGDAPSKVEYEIIKKYCPDKDICPILRSDVLKLGHHGSRNSSAGRFLELVSPSEVVVSASKNNSYKHPHEETMNRVYDQRRKKPLYIRETSREGNIIYQFVSN